MSDLPFQPMIESEGHRSGPELPAAPPQTESSINSHCTAPERNLVCEPGSAVPPADATSRQDPPPNGERDAMEENRAAAGEGVEVKNTESQNDTTAPLESAHAIDNPVSDDTIPSEKACIEAQLKLNGLIAMGMMKPGHAMAIRANLRDTIDYHRHRQSREVQTGVSDASLRALFDRDPLVLNWFLPFLTPDQKQLVQRWLADG